MCALRTRLIFHLQPASQLFSPALRCSGLHDINSCEVCGFPSPSFPQIVTPVTPPSLPTPSLEDSQGPSIACLHFYMTHLSSGWSLCSSVCLLHCHRFWVEIGGECQICPDAVVWPPFFSPLHLRVGVSRQAVIQYVSRPFYRNSREQKE